MLIIQKSKNKNKNSTERSSLETSTKSNRNTSHIYAENRKSEYNSIAEQGSDSIEHM